VPLFVEELTKMVVESGLVRAQGDRYELTGALPPLAIPATLQDSLMARLDRLAAVKDVAQVGAALGRSFSYELLRAVAAVDESTLDRSLAALVEAEFLHQRGVPPQATYLFKHALIQDAAYQSLLLSRRQQLHQRIVHALRDRFADTMATQPELVAHHCTQAGLASEAVEYWRRAGERAIERSANVEATAHLTRGLDLLQELPDTPERAQRELGLQTALGLAMGVSKGWGAPETERTHARARQLCGHVDASPQLFLALQGLGGVHCVRGEIRPALELMEEALRVAQRLHDPSLIVQGHFLVADQLFWFPELVSSRAHLEQALAGYDPTRDRARGLQSLGWDPCVASLTFLGRVLWHLGYPDQARQCSDRALAMTDDMAHPFSRAWALSWAAALHQLYREVDQVQQLADADVALATEQVMMPFFGGHGMVLQGWALVRQGHGGDGLAQLEAGVAAYRATGAELERSHWLSLLAEAYGALGQPEEGLRVLTGALDEIQRNGVRYYEPELHRLRGELLLAAGRDRERDAETSFLRAIDVASRQGAKSLELRATTSLSRLLDARGRRVDAGRLLTGIYGWFTEGFDTADLKEAKEILERLS
jgi:predicted ATPase